MTFGLIFTGGTGVGAIGGAAMGPTVSTSGGSRPWWNGGARLGFTEGC